MSLPVGPCCATGSLHTGTPTGKIEKVHGLDCYVAESSNGSPSGIVVIIPDAFGWVLPNNRILADDYAKNGFKVYLPEFMDGNSLSQSVLTSMHAFKATGWINAIYKVYHTIVAMRYLLPWLYSVRIAVTGPRIDGFLKALRANEAKNLPVGVAGFCWGGYHVTRLSANTTKTDDGNRLIEAGFVAHPSALKYPDDIEKIVLPYSCAAAEHDMQMDPKQAEQTKTILQAKSAKSKDQGIEHEFVMYEGAWHGFAVRAEENEEHEAAQGKKAEKQAVDWFQRWFKNPPPSSI